MPANLLSKKTKKKKSVKKREKSLCCSTKNNRVFNLEYYVCNYSRLIADMLFFINFAMDKKKVNVKEKVGGYLFDVSKYVLTALLVTMFFNDISSSKLMTYAIGAVVALGTLIWGIVFYNDK